MGWCEWAASFQLAYTGRGYEYGTKPGHVTLPNVNHCLRRLRHELGKVRLIVLLYRNRPPVLVGLQWNEVFPLIQQDLGDLSIPIYIYTTYQKGKKASEPSMK